MTADRSRPPTRSLRPVNPGNARPPRLAATAGTRLVRTYSPGTVNPPGFARAGFFPGKRSLRPAGLHPPRGVAGSRFRALPKTPHCCPPGVASATREGPDLVSVPVWLADLSAQLPVIGLVGRYPTNYLIRRSPIQRRSLQDRAKTLSARALSRSSHLLGISAVSRGYPHPLGRLATRY